MATFILRRLLALIPLLFIISLIVFGSVYLRNNPSKEIAREIEGGSSASPAAIAKVAREFHLDESFTDRYGRWLGDAVQGDLGTSWFHRDQPVATEIKNRFPVTFSIAIGGILLSLLIGVPLGILAGTRPGSWADRFATLGSSFGIAMPDFWLAILLVIFFAVNRNILPSSDYVNFADSPSQWAEHLIMPWIALGLGGAAALMRQLRGAFIDTLDQDYIRTAHANGLKPRSITLKHAFKNAAMPAVTVLGIQIAYALGGTVVMERIFSLPGLGQYALSAIDNADIPVLQGVVMVFALTFVFMNLLVDIVYAFLNPKVRLA
jgi:peptide/nickel transport system permease protein